MATPTHRGAVLAARTIKTQQARGLTTQTLPALASGPAATPAQRKMLKRIEGVRTKEINKLVSNLSLFGPMPAPTPSASKQPAMQLMNPFLARKSIKNGKWHPPAYSLRRQADLAKMALKTGNLDKLPPGPKTTALKDRIARVKQSLPQADVKRLERSIKQVSLPVPKAPIPHQFSAARRVEAKLEKSIAERKQRLTDTMERLENEEASEEEKEMIAARITRGTRKEEAGLVAVTEHIKALQKNIDVHNVILKAQHEERERRFTTPIEWVGKLPAKKKGSELGIRLYAGKRRMFKGHLWERKRAERVKKQAILMHHMAARVANYKEVCSLFASGLVCSTDLHCSTTRRGDPTRSSLRATPSLPSCPSSHLFYIFPNVTIFSGPFTSQR